MTNIFTYGTFMTGFHNHRYVKNYTAEKAILYDYSRIWPEKMGFPIIIEQKNDYVKGELYRNVSDLDMEEMDLLEGVPYFYKKRIVEVFRTKEKDTINAIVYYPNDNMIKNWIRAANQEKKNTIQNNY